MESTKLADHSILFVGNPGTGKSSLLNTQGGEFASGYHAGCGLTDSISSRNVLIQGQVVTLVDIPGINEPAQRERNMQFLRQAIQEADGIKVVFLVRSDGGRLCQEDIALVKTLVHGTNGINKIGIIINKCSLGDEQHHEILERQCREQIKRVDGRSLDFDFLFVKRYEEPGTGRECLPPNTAERLLSFLARFVPVMVTFIDWIWDWVVEAFWAVLRMLGL